MKTTQQDEERTALWDVRERLNQRIDSLKAELSALQERAECLQAEMKDQIRLRLEADERAIACDKRVEILTEAITTLRDAKGRHNSAIAYGRLMEALEDKAK